MKITVLGCGTSAGVPQINGGWGKCDKREVKNNRTRCSIVIEHHNAVFLVDTSADMRQQLLKQNIVHVDTILYTHGHADHVHGIDDTRWLCLAMNSYIDCYMSKDTYADITTRFSYCFTSKEKAIELRGKFYRPALVPHVIEYNENFDIKKINFTSMLLNHGFSNSTGYIVDNFAYCVDVVEFSDKNLAMLKKVNYLIVDCLRMKKHNTHMNLDYILWLKKRLVNIKQIYLSHMNYDMDYNVLLSNLPKGITPLYDGMIIKI